MEKVQIQNNIGRDITLSIVPHRQKTTAKNGKQIVVPVGFKSLVLKQGDVTAVPKPVWDANVKTTVIAGYVATKKLQVVREAS